MPRPKAQIPQDDAIRKRVFKACQRCRLKKCKCDGVTPCTRCKSDDAICSYGKHKKSDKITFRKGYVQMLERQHAQLIAGVQELYRRTQNGQGWTQPPLELVNHGQPLTHKILEGLGVLRTEEWDDGEGQDGMPSWVSFEQQAQEGGGIIYDGSQTSSPAVSPTLSPTSAVQGAFLNSQIMAKRISNYDLPTSHHSSTSSMTAPHHFNGTTFPLSTEPNLLQAARYNSDLHLQIPPPVSAYNCNGHNSHNHPGMMNNSMSEQNLPFGSIDWMSLTDDMFEPPVNQGLPLQVQ